MKKILVSLAPLRGDGTVSGVHPQAVARIKSDIANLSNNPQQLDPPFLLFPHEQTLDGKTVIAVQVRSAPRFTGTAARSCCGVRIMVENGHNSGMKTATVFEQSSPPNHKRTCPMDKQLQALQQNLEAAAQRADAQGIEFWFARDLQAHLGYTRWENFQTVIQRAFRGGL